MKFHQTGKGLESLICKKAKKSTKLLIEKLDAIKTALKTKITNI
jgi:hypothetical protein